MTSPLAQDIAWLSARLQEADSAESRTLIEQVRTQAAESVGKAAPAPGFASLDDEQIHRALKLLTIRFHLRNKAEQVHIARVNRQREHSATIDAPRPESLAEAVRALAQSGLSLADVIKTLELLDIRPTLTAHPTESRRRSVMLKQNRIADLLNANNDPQATPVEQSRARSRVRQSLGLLLATDEVRARRLDVIDEVRNGISFLAGAIWDAVPALYHDLAESLRIHFGSSPELPVFLRYRTWIGGDRDGNPNVTAETTARALAEMRAAAIERHAAALEDLRQELSISDRRVAIDPVLRESIARDEKEHAVDPELVRHLAHEPFRVKIRHMQARLGKPEYTAEQFVDDLEVLRAAARSAGLKEVAERGTLVEAIIRAKTFGFHLAALDIRQHSRVHEEAVAEMFHLAGVEAAYDELDESAKRQLLQSELRSSRPLLARGVVLSDQTRELLESLRTIASAIQNDRASIGSYIVSMSHELSDLLEVIILLREVGLWTIQDGVVQCPIDIAPLFETVDDLGRASKVMTDAFLDEAYTAHLRARSNFQEIMLGYSDSNKDGGYWAANWRLHNAQGTLADVCNKAGVSFRFFHGRGGTVARGGGRAHRAILASPAAARNGRIRFTEQGEVISFRYTMPQIARRHLEQIANAMILATAPASKGAAGAPRHDDLTSLFENIAARSRSAYRSLIDDPEFWPWFVSQSPVLHIGELPIASRPVSRSGGEIRFENLRAIPWVFSWTQMRYNAPGWFGLGSALAELVLADPKMLNRCQSAYQEGGFFRAFMDNAQQEMSRARLSIARWYSGGSGASGASGGKDSRFHALLAEEFGRAERAVLAITGQSALLDNNPVIQQSIRERNPDTDAINALQVELLRRWRAAGESEKAELRPLILLSVNALAAAMQSTG